MAATEDLYAATIILVIFITLQSVRHANLKTKLKFSFLKLMN